MNEKEFRKLIKINMSQVLLFSTPANPFMPFITHTYFVTNEMGKISRWEILQRKKRCQTSWGHLHLNYIAPWLGFVKFPFIKRSPRYSGKLLAVIEGDVAKKIINFLKKTPKIYRYNNNYFPFPGPNSNTYVQWVLLKFPESQMRLPWNAIGKSYAENLKHKTF